MTLDPFVHRRAAPDPLASEGRRPNRRERRSIEQRVAKALRDSGCTCVPVLVPDTNGLGGYHVHALDCPLELRLRERAAAGKPLVLHVDDPRCRR
jgi:hypothetical protein